MSDFSYNLQYGGTEFEAIDDKGIHPIDYIIKEFESFNWSDEVKNNEGKEMCCPTFSIVHLKTKVVYWASADGTSDNYSFMSGMELPLIKLQTFFGLLTKEVDQTPTMAYDLEYSVVRKAVDYFLASDFKGTYKCIYNKEPTKIDFFRT